MTKKPRGWKGGRKPIGDQPKISVTITIDPHILEQLDTLLAKPGKGRGTRSAWVEQAISERLEKEGG